MSRGKYQSKRKPFPIVIVLLITLLVAGLPTGGAVAYLAKSADPVTNTFKMAQNPTLTVNDDNSVTVGDFGYAVYVRAAVVPNWKNGNNVIATASTFTVNMAADSKWFEHTDGFYYYKEPIPAGGTTTRIFESVTADPETDDTLAVDIAVQAIQALGTTDAGDETAVLNAWKVQPDEQTP